MSMIKKCLLFTILILFNLILFECGSAFVLYHDWARQPKKFVSTDDLASLATLELAQQVGRRLGLKLPSSVASPQVTSVPAPFFVPDPELGYTVRPGSYQILIAAGAAKYQFHASIRPDGSRATSYVAHQAKRHIYIFGDSVTWGWPNEDEQTFAWLLQQGLPQYSVRNFAQNGYGNLQALIQLRKLRKTLGSDDVVLLVYGDYFNVRNVAAPSRLREFRAGRRKYSYSSAMTYPKGVLKQGKLEIEYVPLLCDVADGYCSGQDPNPNEMFEVTKAIFSDIIDMVPAHICVAYIGGSDQGDPVIDFLKQRGVDVIDIRPSTVFYEVDSLKPFDGHPGPIAQYHYFSKLLKYFGAMEGEFYDPAGAAHQ